MFLKLTNYDTNGSFLVNPDNFIIHEPTVITVPGVAKLGQKTEIDAVMLCPWTSPNVGIRVKEDFNTIMSMITECTKLVKGVCYPINKIERDKKDAE